MTSYVNLCGSRHGGFKPRFRRRDTKQYLRVARHTYPPVSDAETSVRVQLGIEVDDGRRQPCARDGTPRHSRIFRVASDG